MATKSVLGTWSARLDAGLNKLHGVIRSGSEDAAVALYLKLIGNLFEAEFARQDIRREAEFLRVVDASKAIGPEASGRKITPRQALIAAALGGWFGDEPSDWITDFAKRVFVLRGVVLSGSRHAH